MTIWPPLICHAAVSSFNRTGKVGKFQLKRGDMISLVAQITGVETESVRRDIESVEGYSAIRCMVSCEALGRAVCVEEWQ